MLFYIKNYLY